MCVERSGRLSNVLNVKSTIMVYHTETGIFTAKMIHTGGKLWERRVSIKPALFYSFIPSFNPTTPPALHHSA